MAETSHVGGSRVFEWGVSFASAADKSRLHDFRFLRRRSMFAFVLEASQELVATLLALGILTAVAEYVLRSSSEHQP